MKQFFFYIFFQCFTLLIWSQPILKVDSVFLENVTKEVSDFNKKKLKKTIRTVPCDDIPKTYKVFNIVLLNYTGEFVKRKFTNGSFMKEVSMIYYRDKILKSNILLWDMKGKLIASGDYRFLMCLSRYNKGGALKNQELLANFIKKNGVKYAFWLNLTPSETLFYIADNGELRILETGENEVASFSLSEYFETNWDKFSEGNIFFYKPSPPVLNLPDKGNKH